jgi:hypothetical protein
MLIVAVAKGYVGLPELLFVTALFLFLGVPAIIICVIIKLASRSNSKDPPGSEGRRRD